MTVELPKDAEGREIPLDVEFLYNANGESVKPYSFTFNRYDGFGWEMHLVGVQNSVYDPKSFYLTPPDSWEKLLDDLKAVEDYGNSSHLDNPTCHYLNMVGKPCGKCKFYGRPSCIGEMCADIASRIRKLRGEGDV